MPIIVFCGTTAVLSQDKEMGTIVSGIFCNSKGEADHIASHVGNNTREGDARARMMLRIHQGRAGRISKGDRRLLYTAEELQAIPYVVRLREIMIRHPAWCEYGFAYIARDHASATLEKRGQTVIVRLLTQLRNRKYYVTGSSTIVDDIYQLDAKSAHTISARK